jgi:hypothetical protein
MGYKRQLPRTDDARQSILNTAKLRKDGPPPIVNVISQENSDALDAEQPKFVILRNLVFEAKAKDHAATSAFVNALQRLKNLTSHGLQLVNFKVIDEAEGFTEATRKLYGMDLSGHLPAMTTEDEILHTTTDFIDGETARIAEGGTPLLDITKASVVALLETVEEKRFAKQTSGNLLANSQTNLAKERNIVDRLIKLMWSDIEHAAQKMPRGERHEFGISWGMDYKHTPDPATLNVRVIDAESGLSLGGVKLRIGKPGKKDGTKATTNFHGQQIMKSKNFKPTYINASLMGYDTLAKEICLEEDKTTDVVLKMKKTGQ